MLVERIEGVLKTMENTVEEPPISRSPEHTVPLECRVLSGIDGFNATTLLLENGKRVIIWRRQIKEAPESGQPDINMLVATQLVEGELRPDDEMREPAVIWSPLSLEDKAAARQLGRPFLCNLEDPRAGENGFCGLTAVLEKPETATSPAEHTPYAAVVQVPTSEDQAFGSLPEVTILTSLGPGKNATPIGNIYGNEHEETFLFRPEGDPFNHTLQVVTYNVETRETK